ncbi:MAG: PD-(D/E)XK nuclease family protein [Bacteroidales bacterium]|nr:PD-(D/E)XK nuclease family protein [Bacteroidales bacterium]
MNTFLEDCAVDILRKYDNNDSVCVVFPNKRTMLHFRKSYARIKNEVSFSGHLFPIDKVLSQFSKLVKADDLTLLFKLYDAFRQVFAYEGMYNEGIAADFDSFYDSGCKILSDFNEIDNYLVDIHQLCRNFADLSEIDSFYAPSMEREIIEIIRQFWANFSQQKLSREKQRYLELWTGLPKVYDIFRKSLEDDNLCYPGMKNRAICDIIESKGLDTKYETYIFVGFNVLNKCERKIFKYLHEAKKARFYWDADDYYISDRTQEAGLFMRKLIDEFPDELNRKRPPANIIGNPKNVEYIGVPLEVGQAKCVHDIISQLSKQPDYNENRTAVVLGDEHLLFPVLNSLPKCVERVNVTMGYPFVETPVYSFLLNCLQLRRNYRANKTGGDYYYNDVLAVINHPLVVNIPEFCSKQIEEKIRVDRLIRVDAGLLSSYGNLLSIIFGSNENEKQPADIIQTFLSILSELYFVKNPAPSETPKLENEFIFYAYTSLKNLYNNVLTLPQDISADLVVNIMKQHLVSVKVPFESDDDNGIQLTGMMETRNLDFDNVIMIGMNEGVFPKRSENNSFVTEGMRLAFDMPVVKYKDAVFGYFFYRLFQRARNVKILYNNVFSSALSGEPSRFATQILKEASSMVRTDSKLDIQLLQFVREIKPLGGREIDVVNNEDTLQRLSAYFSQDENRRALSPSALNTFIDCPLAFYLKYVIRLRQTEELDEEASAADFGSILHAAIENIYNDIKDSNNKITAEMIAAARHVAEGYVLAAYNDHFKVKITDKKDISGFDSIFFDVLMQYLERILDYDTSIAPFELIGAEKGIYTTVDVVSGGKTLKVNIGGTIDRIDRIVSNGKIRIVDYKTGNVSEKMKFADVESVFDFTKADKRPSQALQVLLYSYVYMQRHNGAQPVPIIYAVRNKIDVRDTYFRVGSNKAVFNVDDSNISALTEEFSVHLKELLSSLFDTTQTFEPRPSHRCDHCDFRGICAN